LENVEGVSRLVELMRTNRRIGSAVSEQMGVQAFFFLQPTRKAYGNNPRAHVALREDAAGTGDDFYDISEPLEAEIQHPYVDWAHYSDKGGLVVAQRMAAVIAPEFKAGQGRPALGRRSTALESIPLNEQWLVR
jgi:hypothetical protein